jgi:hypothetical protein
VKYEDIFFAQNSEDTDEVFEILDDEGEDAAIEYLQQWHYPGEHRVLDESPQGSADTVYEKDGYTLAYNRGLGYIGLVFEVED